MPAAASARPDPRRALPEASERRQPSFLRSVRYREIPDPNHVHGAEHDMLDTMRLVHLVPGTALTLVLIACDGTAIVEGENDTGASTGAGSGTGSTCPTTFAPAECQACLETLCLGDLDACCNTPGCGPLITCTAIECPSGEQICVSHKCSDELEQAGSSLGAGIVAAEAYVGCIVSECGNPCGFL